MPHTLVLSAQPPYLTVPVHGPRYYIYPRPTLPRSWLVPDFAGSFPFDTVIASILANQGNLHSTNFFRFLKCAQLTLRFQTMHAYMWRCESGLDAEMLFVGRHCIRWEQTLGPTVLMVVGVGIGAADCRVVPSMAEYSGMRVRIDGRVEQARRSL